MAPIRTRSWVTIVAVALVLYAVGSLFVQWGVRQNRLYAGPDVAKPNTADDVVDEALRQIPATVDSAEIKTGWRDEVPGLELGDLTAAQRELFLRAANAQMCSCGCGFTLAACRTYDATCPVSGPKVAALRDSVRAGLVAARGLRTRPSS